MFRILRRSKKSHARFGELRTFHGVVPTPAFMPIATRGAVKGVTSHDMAALGSDILLANTYHLWLRPGLSVLKKHGGLHSFMGWNGPLLTDSGGFQVFSLAKLRTVTERGATFRNPVDGKTHTLTPERSMEIQKTFGSDFIMAFDDVPGYPVTKTTTRQSMERTTRWATRCLNVKLQKHQYRFGIVQGGVFPDLRKKHAAEMTRLPFDAFAIGGVSVGEPPKLIKKILALTTPLLPENKPRYVMGMGTPDQIVDAVKKGIDMFDCVLPTRDGRHGRLYVWKNRATLSWKTVNVKNASFARDIRLLDAACSCPLCTHHSRSFLRHLFAINESLGARLATLHNITFYLELFRLIRTKIRNGGI